MKVRMQRVLDKKNLLVIDKNMNLNNLMIDTLEKYNNQMKEKGFIPTVDMLIEDLKEIEIKKEAQRLINNDKAND